MHACEYSSIQFFTSAPYSNQKWPHMSKGVWLVVRAGSRAEGQRRRRQHLMRIRFANEHQQPEYKIDDLVMVVAPRFEDKGHIAGGKFKKKFIGPYKITGVIGKRTYELKPINGMGNPIQHHSNNWKLYHEILTQLYLNLIGWHWPIIGQCHWHIIVSHHIIGQCQPIIGIHWALFVGRSSTFVW